MERKERRQKLEPIKKTSSPKENNTELRLYPYEYIWGGQIRDKRSNSMCARPYYRTNY